MEMRRWLAEVGSIALALISALVVWAVAEQANNPAVIVRSVPVGDHGMEAGIALVSPITEAVDVRLRAPSQVLQSLRVEDFEASVDLAGLPAGRHTVGVQVASAQADVQILGVISPTIEVTLESVMQKAVTVRAAVMDSPAEGYDAGPPVVDPDTVLVSGPSSLVESVEVATAEVYLRGARSTVESTWPVWLRSQGGLALGNAVVWSPRRVSVTVPIEQQPGFRDVTVRVRWEGQPARGYRISEVAVAPSIVTLSGSAAAIEAAPGYVETMPVNIEGADANIVERLALIVPENVSVEFDVTSVVVSVGITAIEESTWVQRAPVIQGLDERHTVDLSPGVVEVLLAGPLPRLESLRPGDVQVVLDLSGLDTGTYSLSPLLVLPEGIRQETLVPETIEVKVMWLPTATPTRTPTPTLAPTEPATATVTPAATATPTPTLASAGTPALPPTPTAAP
jgi:YbbR domain-containing protein